jgi:glycosyltransferase involved in cell wall biosynthesis
MVLDLHQTALALRRASRLIATRADLVPERYRDKLRLVRWGANTHAFHPGVSGAGVRRAWGIAEQSLVVGYAGGFYSWHGLEELVAAAALLRDLNARFLLVGDGERAALVRSLVKKAGVSDQFIFTGRVPYERVPEYIAACDVCAAPYNPARLNQFRHGEFVYDPLKLFEAMAMGKPMVTLRAGNIEAMFTHGRELITVPPGDAPALAAQLRLLLVDPQRRASLGAAARQAVETRYSWAAHTQHLRQLFAEIMAERA